MIRVLIKLADGLAMQLPLPHNLKPEKMVCSERLIFNNPNMICVAFQ